MLFENFQEYKHGATGSFTKNLNYQSKFHPEKTIYTQHGDDYIPLLFETIRKFAPDMSDKNPLTFIELGTSDGGLTLILHEEFGNSLEIFSFDKSACISDKDKNFLFDSKIVTFYVENILFHEDKTKLSALLKELSGTKKILYCDNGNKEDEINFYAKYLDSEDLLGCHDYFVQLDPTRIKDTIKDFEMFNWDRWERSFLLSRFWIKK